jgi:hypothetical protein
LLDGADRRMLAANSDDRLLEACCTPSQKPELTHSQ